MTITREVKSDLAALKRGQETREERGPATTAQYYYSTTPSLLSLYLSLSLSVSILFSSVLLYCCVPSCNPEWGPSTPPSMLHVAPRCSCYVFFPSCFALLPFVLLSLLLIVVVVVMQRDASSAAFIPPPFEGNPSTPRTSPRPIPSFGTLPVFAMPMSTCSVLE